MRRRFVLRAVKGIGSCWQIACRVPADDARGSKDAVPCDGGWLAMGWRVSRGELAGRWLAESRRMRHRGQRIARSEMADAVQGAARCYAERRQMACRGPSDVVPCVEMVCDASAGGAQRVEGWCAGSKRMVRGGSASCQQKALGGYI